MNPVYQTKKAIMYVIHALGYEIYHLKKNPYDSILGLIHYPIRTIIDVGANRGQFAGKILQTFPGAQIHCIEPLSEPYQYLEKWAADVRANISLHNVALGDCEGDIKMNLHVEHDESSSILDISQENISLFPQSERQRKIIVHQTTLDDLFGSKTCSLEKEILIKMDVQGYEDRVIQGGIKTLDKARACIMEVCLESLYLEQASFRCLVDMMYDLDFRYAGNLQQTQGKDDKVIFIDAVFIKND
ncbi:MAG: FkbM family methyltransferase [Deltaproteobacteria bacterium]|nr:FkbM family methyltransferase [Deltaproteobacteria bacterium]